MRMVKSGKPVHCVETLTGKNLTGLLTISDEDIRVKIYSYANFFEIEEEKPIVLRTETNEIVTLHSSITINSGQTSRRPQTIYHQELVSNIAVVGHDPWKTEDGVSRVTFNVKHSKGLMRHKAKVSAIGGSRYPERDQLTIFADHAEGMTLKAWYAPTYGAEFEAPKELQPVFGIEFHKPRSIRDYIGYVLNYVRFLSFCLGVQLKPSEICVDRLSIDDLEKAIESGSYLGVHMVHYIWREPEIDTDDFWRGGSPALSWDDEELGSLRACLVVWMNRAAEWKKSYTLMMASFGLRGVVSAERLINACRWLEDIPIAQSQNALADGDVEAIVDAAISRGQELGLSRIIRERIAGALRWVKTESAEERFTRLVVESRRSSERAFWTMMW